MDDPLHIKLVVVGDDIIRDITSPKPRNMKTEFLMHYASNSSPRGSITTSIDNYYRVNVSVRGQPAVLELFDTSGQAEYDRVRPLSYSNANLFMLVFSVLHDTSFENISIKWFPEVSHFCPAVPIILVGINTHKRNKPSVVARIYNQGDKIISTEMGEDLKNSIGAVAYRECSASNGVGIKETFETALSVAWLSMKEGKKPSSIAKNPTILPMRDVYASLLHEAYHAGDLDAMCNVRDAQDQSDLIVKDATETKIEFEILQRIRHETKGLALRRCNFKSLTNYFISQFKQLDVLDLSRNLLSDAFNDAVVWKLIVLDLSRNYFTSFPINLERFPALKILSLAHNYIKEIPPCVAEFHKLELDVSHNLIENLHPSLLTMNLDATGNPFTGVLPEYRMDPDKILMYLRNIQSQSAVGWKQVKLMLVGQEAVGKTTLLRALEKEKLTSAHNVSTNGVNIAQLTLEHSAPLNLFNLFTKKQTQQEQQVRFSVWDFGGQAVFHSTHRLFITPFALYVVLYDMSKPETRERVRYWIEQIGDDAENTKPILIVGTHADLLTKEERTQLIQEMESLYPTPNRAGSAKIQGHCAVSLLHSEKSTLIELTNKLVDLALDHPKIGVRHVKVPKCIEALQTTLEGIKSETQYLRWSEYVTVCKKLGIPEEYIQDNTTILHDTGTIVWHNVPKLRDTVIIDPQWLADAMSGVVSFMCQSSVALSGGIISWQKIKESLRLKFPDSMHLIAISMLEFFEIIYKMRASKILKVNQRNNDEQMFFVPSLLYPFEKGLSHPALQYWDMMETSHTFVRRFSWKFFPAGFFPRLLLRLVHLRLRPLVCWLDAAVILGTDGHECAFMQLSRDSENDPFVLEVQVKVKEMVFREASLVAELAYMISQLHQDMYFPGHSHDAPLVHQIVVPQRNAVISFESCIKAEIEGKPLITVDGHPFRINQFLPDLNGCTQIPATAIQILEKIGKGGFGEVYQGIMKSEDVDGTSLSIQVALKELQQMEESHKFYDFQHEVMIMSKLNHVNLVHLYGIIKSPLRMVMEYIPNSDLHSLLKTRQVLSFKLRLKIAIDCASGVRYLHSQSPVICHNDLRAPNLFIASLDENGEVIAKVADFGLSRQLFPFSQKALHNLMETAPETWEGNPYDEKSDIFSFAIILWRLFGTKSQNGETIGTPHNEDEIDDSEREYLKANGKYCPPPKQREIIRKGGRPPIHAGCPRMLESLIKKCWHTSPESRPSITNILGQLMSTYMTYFSEDNYLASKRKEIDEEELSFGQPSSSDYSFKNSQFKSRNWKPVNSEEFGAAPTTVLQLPTEVWFGTPMGGLAMFDKESTQFMQYKLLPTTESPGSRRATKRTILLSTGENCIWAALGSEIHIISTITRDVITLPLQNNYPITAMVLLPLKYIWVADTEGFISIWDAQTLQKCYRFRVHPQDCAQIMTVLHNYVCMGVGRKLIAVHIHTLDIINALPAHGDRIHDILAVPHCNQVWTCTRDGYVSAWVFSSVDLNNSPPSALSLSPPPSRARSPSSPAPSRVPTSPPTSPPLSPRSPPSSSPPAPSFILEPARALVRSTRGSTLLLAKEGTLPSARRNTVSSSQPSVPSPSSPSGPSSPPKASFAPRSPGPKRPSSPVEDPTAVSQSMKPPPLPPKPSSSSSSTTSPPPLPPKPSSSSPSSPAHLAQNCITVQMRFNTNLKTPAKCACLLSDGGHVCVGTFDGSIYVWNVQTFEQHAFPMPDIVKGHNIPCMIDTEYGLWCSVEDIQHPLMFHRHVVLSQQNEVLACSTHGRKFHDAFISYKFFYEGSKSLVSPVEALYNSLSMQQKKKSIGEVTVFWDEKCHPYGQSWERSFFHAVTTSKVIILLISAQTLEGIKKNALNKQDNVLVEYECAIMQNKLHKTPVIPVFVAGAQKTILTGELIFTPFDFKDLDPTLFPRASHARSEDAQFIIDNMSKPMGSNDKKFLKSISATIEQLGKLQGYLLLKRGTDEQELQKIVDQVMEELER